MPGYSGGDNRVLLLFPDCPMGMMSFLHEEGTGKRDESGNKKNKEHRPVSSKGILIRFTFPIRIKDLSQDRHENSAAEERKQVHRSYTGTCNLNREKLFRGGKPHDHNCR